MNLIRNNIPIQNKSMGDQISFMEWNKVVNQLATQANMLTNVTENIIGDYFNFIWLPNNKTPIPNGIDIIVIPDNSLGDLVIDEETLANYFNKDDSRYPPTEWKYKLIKYKRGTRVLEVLSTGVLKFSPDELEGLINSKFILLSNRLDDIEAGAEPAFTKKTAFNKDFGTTADTVAQGNDPRMTNARPASDVSVWAKAANKPTYTAAEVGLGNVDNTADLSKPISTATQTALNLKADKTQLSNYVTVSAFDMQMLEKLGTKPNGTDLLIINGMINPLYIDDTSYKVNHPTVNSQAEMLALDVPIGTVVVRLDTPSKELFILTKLPTSELSSWQLVSSNTVVSVAGKTGVIVLGISDVDGLTNALNLKLDVITFINEVARLEDLINTKADKVAGKGLSTNDFTNVLKNKLDGIEEGAEVNKVDSVNGKQGVIVLNQDDIGDGTTYKRISQAEKNTWNNKQDELIAGDNITIIGNVISATSGGGGGIDMNDLPYMTQVSGVLASVGRYDELETAWNNQENFSVNTSGSMTGYTEQDPHVLDIVIPRNVKSIPNYTSSSHPFKKTNYTSITIPNSVTSIGDYTFRYWSSNNQPLVIPNSVTSIGTYAFYSWSSNNQPLVIPNSVTSIGNGAFYKWSSNNQPLVIPNSVTSIGNGAFNSWSSNNQPLVISNSVTSIGNSTFIDWSSNKHPLVIPNSVTSIGTYAFSSWSSNNHPLVIPNSVTSIGGRAFSSWSSNKHPLVIPNSVTSIGTYAFSSWSLVPYVELKGETPPTLSSESAFDGQNNAPIYVPDGSVDAYKNATNWSALSSRIFSINEKP